MTSPSGYVVGIDGGGTRTRYLLADIEGKILARRVGRGTLIGAGRDREIAEDIGAHIQALIREAGANLPLHALCAGLAGSAGRPEGTRLFQEELHRMGVASHLRVLPDAEVAFEDAFGEEVGILLVAGTGSIALGRGKEGTLRRVGGWGALLGDEGSAYGIALQGVRAAIRGKEGRGEPTHLTSLLFDLLGVDSVRGVLEWSQSAEKGGVAALAPAIFDAAQMGDQVANLILDAALAGLVEHARALRRILFAEGSPESPPIAAALVGGIIEAGGPLHDALRRELNEEGISVLTEPVNPARGAVRMALRM